MKSDYTEVQVKILDAARKLFVKKGLKGTTVRDIAAESGVNAAMVNYYFRSKERLYDEIFDEAFRLIAGRIFYLLDSDLPFFELIRSWINSYYDTLLDYPDFPNFVLSGVSSDPQKVAGKFLSVMPPDIPDRLAERIAREAASGTIEHLSVPDFVLNIISLSIFPFSVMPVATQVVGMRDDDYLRFLDRHREYVVDFVIRAIKKGPTTK